MPLNLDGAVSYEKDFDLLVSLGLISGYNLINKFGRNTDIDSGSTPEDVWELGGVYSGFPTGAPEEFEVFSDSASDTGTLTFSYLASSASTEYATATVTLNGTTAVSTAITGYRIHTVNYSSGNSTGFNVGIVTIRHKITTANVFCSMTPGRSQSNVCAYTVPAGCSAVIKRLFCRVVGATAGYVDGGVWTRSLNGSPRLRRPFSAAQQDHFEEFIYGGLQLTSGTDVIIRVGNASTNGLDVIAGYDLVCVRTNLL